MMKFFAFFVVFLGLTNLQAQTPEGQFIETLYKQSITELKNKSLSDNARRAKFRTMLEKNFDIAAISRFVVGREVLSKASPAQFENFRKTFEDYIVSHYYDQFQKQDTASFSVTKTLAGNRFTTVESKVVVAGDQNAKMKNAIINWQLIKRDSGFKVYDLIIENISLMMTKRDEFAVILNNSKMNIDVLSADLRKKIVKNE